MEAWVLLLDDPLLVEQPIMELVSVARLEELL